MIEYIIVALVIGVIAGVIRRISSKLLAVIGLGIACYNLGVNGPVGHALWCMETAVALVGFLVGMPFGCLITDWLVSITNT